MCDCKAVKYVNISRIKGSEVNEVNTKKAQKTYFISERIEKPAYRCKSMSCTVIVVLVVVVTAAFYRIIIMVQYLIYFVYQTNGKA